MAKRMTKMVSKVKVYEAIIKAGERYRLPSPWDRFESHGAFRRIPADLDPLLNQLVEQFDTPALIAAGVLVIDGANEPIANPRLAEFRDCLLTIGRPAAFATMIAGPESIDGSPAVITLLQCAAMEPLIRNAGGRIFITFTAADLAVLWSMRLPAIPGESLAALGGDELEEFCELLRLRRSGAEKPKHSFETSKTSSIRSPIFPVLVDWSPAALTLADNPGVRKAEMHFSKISRYLRLDLHGGGAWKPTEAQVEELKFAIQYGKPEDVFVSLLKSSETNRVPFSGCGGDSGAVSNSFAMAIEQWQASCDQNDARKLSDAWSGLRRAHAEELINPLIMMSQATSDPLDKNDLAVLAQISDVFHQRAAVSAARLSKAVASQGLKSFSDIPADEFRAIDSLMRGIFSKTKEIKSCHKKKGRPLGSPLKSKSS